jgi:hypothetical protein
LFPSPRLVNPAPAVLEGTTTNLNRTGIASVPGVRIVVREEHVIHFARQNAGVPILGLTVSPIDNIVGIVRVCGDHTNS